MILADFSYQIGGLGGLLFLAAYAGLVAFFTMMAYRAVRALEFMTGQQEELIAVLREAVAEMKRQNSESVDKTASNQQPAISN